MAHLPHQLEDAQFQVQAAIQKHNSLALRDGVYDEHERHLYDVLQGIAAAIGLHVNSDKLAAAIQKGVHPGQYLNQLAHAVGYHVDAHEPPPSTVTPFPDRANHG